jgi:hypothetical protein
MGKDLRRELDRFIFHREFVRDGRTRQPSPSADDEAGHVLTVQVSGLATALSVTDQVLSGAAS